MVFVGTMHEQLANWNSKVHLVISSVNVFNKVFCFFLEVGVKTVGYK